MNRADGSPRAAFRREDLLLYAVTDRRWLQGKSLAEAVRESLQGGVSIVQLREKEMHGETLRREADAIKAVCRSFQVPFLVNDDVETALAVGAEGVHIGQEDMSAVEARRLLGDGKILGVSAQTVAQAKEAEAAGADYLGVGAVFATGTKADAQDVSIDTLKEICRAVTIPVVAIGGITKENLPLLSGTGIAGAAVVSAIFAQPDIERASRELREILKGGAGIQADLKTMLAHGVYGMSAIAAMTAQNTQGVTAIQKATPEFLGAQLDCVFSDIPPDAVKTGMVFSADLIEAAADRLKHYRARNIVVDPVMVATSGARLLDESASASLKSLLFPLAALITPNLMEAEALAERKIENRHDMEEAAKTLQSGYGCAVLCKGGHRIGDADDLLCDENGLFWLKGERVDNPNTHGTGCTLSSAIASNLALGFDLRTAVLRAKDYLTGALRAGLDLGHGAGPLDHGYALTSSR